MLAALKGENPPIGRNVQVCRALHGQESVWVRCTEGSPEQQAQALWLPLVETGAQTKRCNQLPQQMSARWDQHSFCLIKSLIPQTHPITLQNNRLVHAHHTSNITMFLNEAGSETLTPISLSAGRMNWSLLSYLPFYSNESISWWHKQMEWFMQKVLSAFLCLACRCFLWMFASVTSDCSFSPICKPKWWSSIQWKQVNKLPSW